MLIQNDLQGAVLLQSAQGSQRNQSDKSLVQVNRQDSPSGKLTDSLAPEAPVKLNNLSFDQALAQLREDEERVENANVASAKKQGRDDEQLQAALSLYLRNQPLSMNQGSSAAGQAVEKAALTPLKTGESEFTSIPSRVQNDVLLKQRLQLQPTLSSKSSKNEDLKGEVEQSLNLSDLQKTLSQDAISQGGAFQNSAILKKSVFDKTQNGGENSLTQPVLSPWMSQQNMSENMNITELPSEGKNFVPKWSAPKKATTAFLREGAGQDVPSISGDNFFPREGSPVSTQHPVFLKELPAAAFNLNHISKSDRSEDEFSAVDFQKPGSRTSENPQIIHPFLTGENASSMPAQPEVTAYVTSGANAKDRLSSESLMKISAEVKHLSSNGGGVMNVRLKPEGMGELSMRIVTDGHRVGLKIETSHEKTKQMIEESLKYLGDSLSTHQLVLGNVDLSVVSTDLKHFSQNPNDHKDSQDLQRFDLNMSQNKPNLADSGNRGEGQHRSSQQVQDDWEIGLMNRRQMGPSGGMMARFSPSAGTLQAGRIDMRV